LSDKLETTICEFIAAGMSVTDSCRLAGLHRSTAWNWKVKGEQYLEDPEAHPGDERFGQFAKRCEEAQLRAKVIMINRIARDPDWRALRWLLINCYPKKFRSEHQIEVSGPDGGAIPIAVNPFNVQFIMTPAAEMEFEIVDHTEPLDGRIHDPYVIQPKKEGVKKLQ
jgi:hypothetical protein